MNPTSDSAQNITDSQKRLSRSESAKEKLSSKCIREASRKPCCSKCCLHVLGAKKIRSAREKFFRQSSSTQNSCLQQMISANGGVDKSHLSYSLEGHSVCSRAFREVLTLGWPRISRLQLIGFEDPSTHTPAGLQETNRTLTLRLWLEEFFKYHCECLPNKSVRHLPAKFTKTTVYSIFLEDDSVSADSSQCSFSHFIRTWNKHFADVKIPATNRFSSCSQCGEYRAMLQKAVLQDEKGLCHYPYSVISSSNDVSEKRVCYPRNTFHFSFP